MSEIAIVELTRGGRVTIPKEIRVQLRWNVGDKVRVLVDEERGQVLLRRVPKEAKS